MGADPPTVPIDRESGIGTPVVAAHDRAGAICMQSCWLMLRVTTSVSENRSDDEAKRDGCRARVA